MEDIFKKPKGKRGVSNRSLAFVRMIKSPEFKCLLARISFEDRSKLRLSEEIYYNYELINRSYKISLRSFCMLLEAMSNNSWRFYRNLFNVFKHFVVFCQMDCELLGSVSFWTLRFISESGFDKRTTRKVIEELNGKTMSKKHLLDYLKNIRDNLKRINNREL